MKKIGLMLGLILLVSAFTVAQSQSDYIVRNHKLNKGSMSKGDKIEAPVAINKSQSQDDAVDYKNRNHKFHKSTHDDYLVIEKERIVNDYRAYNHKFSKGKSVKFMNRLSRDELLTEN